MRLRLRETLVARCFICDNGRLQTNLEELKMKGFKMFFAAAFLLSLAGCSDVELPGDLEARQDHTGFESCKDSALPCTAMW
ncbi:hypothetical protein [Pseudomonas fluorescens]|uniref:Uncharacterized protein n=1 Tax=Pseudomonas fluorescens TaxID=294 RepID=A0A0D0MX82_PSEFL|nr:hypothetical protein [Pseudomonas fluorescens]KIQ60175.1 hypothetical protein RL74_06675 [Pseudomonas fluorescens]